MILVIDNYDSFTFNLVQMLGGLGAEVVVRRNDEIEPDGVAALAPERIVVSPGPRTPQEAGISVHAYGGRVVRARRLMHGKVSPVAHSGTELFEGVPMPVGMTRYHSLVLDPGTLPDSLEVTAWTAEEGWEDEIQAVRHREHPVWGVQFHPESVASDHGERIVANFLALPA